MKRPIDNPNRRITPRSQTIINVEDKIGCILNNNCFPTLLGKLIGIKDERCYFEIIPNDDYPKYNSCAGQIEYLPESMVITMNFIN